MVVILDIVAHFISRLVNQKQYIELLVSHYAILIWNYLSKFI